MSISKKAETINYYNYNINATHQFDRASTVSAITVGTTMVEGHQHTLARGTMNSARCSFANNVPNRRNKENKNKIKAVEKSKTR